MLNPWRDCPVKGPLGTCHIEHGGQNAPATQTGINKLSNLPAEVGPGAKSACRESSRIEFRYFQKNSREMLTNSKSEVSRVTLVPPFMLQRIVVR
jgi:hypothetical protein